ncbi:MAG: alpha/beta hydrolase-fold protein [Vicinamibacterales bacterium]
MSSSVSARFLPVDGAGHSVTGDVRRLAAFTSAHLPTPRDLLVYLPPGYGEDARRRFPVLYLHDGQNVFDGATSYVPGEEWGVDETAERLIGLGRIEPLIIVAVGNAGRERVNEYGPTVDARRGGGGQAALYGRMLVQEIKPLIDSEFRTRRGQADTAVGGSSLGGLVTLYLGLNWPGTFGRLCVMSPSVWWDVCWVLREFENLVVRLPWRVWLDVGWREGTTTLTNARELRDVMLEKGWRLGDTLRYFEARTGEHSERAWSRRVSPMLQFLFPAPR